MERFCSFCGGNTPHIAIELKDYKVWICIMAIRHLFHIQVDKQ